MVSSAEIEYLLQVIKDTVNRVAHSEGVKVKNIILFGSRARGDFRRDSDWDLLVIIRGSPDRGTIRRLQYQIYRRLAENKLYCDVIVVGEEYYAKYKDVVGSIAHYAQLEGKPIE